MRMVDCAHDLASDASAARDFILPGGDGLPLACSRYGSGENGRVVFAHGFGQTRLAWSRTARRLAGTGFTGLAYDARGHGDSGRNPIDRPYAGEQFLADLGAVSAAAGERPVLVGASMGGLIGLWAESLRPRYAALVLVDITPRWENAGLERILGFMSAHPDGFDSLEHAADAIAAYLPHRRERKAPQQLRALLRQGADGRWRWHWDPRLLDEFARDSGRYQSALLEAVRNITTPVLLVSGGRSDLVSEATVGEFLDHVPHAEHVRLPRATHMVAGDDNDAFTDTILDFLTRRVPAAPIPGVHR